jgi:hypothetical protein
MLTKLPHYSGNKEKTEKANIAGINVELDEYKREIDNFEIEEAQLQIVENLNDLVLFTVISIVLLFLCFYTCSKNNNFKKKIECGTSHSTNNY